MYIEDYMQDHGQLGIPPAGQQQDFFYYYTPTCLEASSDIIYNGWVINNIK